MNESKIGNDSKLLLIIGGIAALIAAILFRRNLSAEYFLFRNIGIFAGEPTVIPLKVEDWFSLFQNSKFFGLLLMNIFDSVNYLLIGLMYAGAYQTLKNVNKSILVLAMLLILSGIVMYFVSNQALGMLALSDQYAHATTESGRSSLIAAGQALLVIHNANTSYSYGVYLSYLFVTSGGLICAVVMLQSKIYGKVTAIIGIVATGFGLGFYLTVFLAPEFNVIPVAGSAPFLMIWYILVGIKMIKIGINIPKAAVNP